MDPIDFQKLIESLPMADEAKTFISEIKLASLGEAQAETLFKKLVQNGYEFWSYDKEKSTLPVAAIANSQLLALKIFKDKINIHETLSDGTTYLSKASLSTVPIVEFLIELGADVYKEALNEHTFLEVATIAGNESVVKFLIEPIKDAERKMEENLTALNHAVEFGHLGIVKWLIIDKGIKSEKSYLDREYYIRSGIVAAARNNHMEIVECLLEEIKDPDEKLKAIIAALKNTTDIGKLQVLSWVVEKKIFSADELVSGEDSILTRAIRNGHVNVIEFLIEKIELHNKRVSTLVSAFNSALNSESLPVLECVYQCFVKNKINGVVSFLRFGLLSEIEKERCTFVEFLVKLLEKNDLEYKLDKIDFQGAFNLAIKKENFKALIYLISYGEKNYPEFSLLSNDLTSLLDGAIMRESFCDVQYLLEYGQRIYQKCFLPRERLFGFLDGAMIKDNTDAVEFLLKYGENFHKRSYLRGEALNRSAQANALAVVEFLMAEEKESSEKLKNYGNMLVIAATFGSQSVLEWLLETAGLNIDEESQEGFTALHAAAKNEKLDILKYLVEHKANTDKKDKDGNTVLHHAAASGRLETVQYLLGLGISMALKNKKGQDAAAIATENAYPEVYKFIKIKTYRDYFKQTFSSREEAQPGRLKEIQILAEMFLKLNVNLEKKVIHVKFSFDDLNAVNANKAELVPEKINLNPSALNPILELLSTHAKFSHLNLCEQLYLLSKEKEELDKKRREEEARLRLSVLEENVLKNESLNLYQQCILLMDKELSEEFKGLHTFIQQYAAEAISVLDRFDEYLCNIPENDKLLLKKYRSKLELNKGRRAEIGKILVEINQFEEARTELNADLPVLEDLKNEIDKEFLKEIHERLKNNKLSREQYSKNLYERKNRLEEIAQSIREDYKKAATHFSKIQIQEKKAEKIEAIKLQKILEEHQAKLQKLEDEKEKTIQKEALNDIRKERFQARQQAYLQQAQLRKKEAERLNAVIPPSIGEEKPLSPKFAPRYTLDRVTDVSKRLEVNEALSDLEKICAIETADDALFKARERHALLGTLTRVMEEVKQLQHRPEWAKTFRDVVYHSDIVFPSKLGAESHTEVKAMALELCAYLRSEPSKVENLAVLGDQFSSALLIEILTFKVPEKYNKESLVHLIESSARELQGYQSMSVEDKQSLLHAHAEGFLTGRISSALSDLRRVSVSRYTALLKKNPEYKASIQEGNAYRHGEAVSTLGLESRVEAPSQHGLFMQYGQSKQATSSKSVGSEISRKTEIDIYERGYRNYEKLTKDEEAEIEACPASAPQKKR